MTKTLTLSTGNFDQINTFNVEVRGRSKERTVTCQLRRDYENKGDGIYWAMSVGSILKDSYTDEDVSERDRLHVEEPVRNGDIMMIDGKPHKARVLGAFSDACIFDEVK